MSNLKIKKSQEDMNIYELFALNSEVRNLRKSAVDNFNQGDFNEAIKLFEDALALDPEFPEIFADLAVCYWSINKLETAQKFLLKALSLDPYQKDAIKNFIVLMENDIESLKLLENYLIEYPDDTEIRKLFYDLKVKINGK